MKNACMKPVVLNVLVELVNWVEMRFYGLTVIIEVNPCRDVKLYVTSQEFITTRLHFCIEHSFVGMVLFGRSCGVDTLVG